MEFKGIITPMITPVKNKKIDFQAISELIEYLLRIGVEGIFPGSSTGAFTLFSLKEHREIIEFSREKFQGKGLFIPGISRNNLEETILMGKSAIDMGADGVVIITPFYLKFGQDAIYRYYAKIADELDIPIFVYNNPDLSCNSIEPETLEKLFQNYSNIIGIKDSSGDMRKFNTFIAHLPSNRYIFQGRDDLLYESLILGASGGVCGTSNFSTLVHELYKKKDLNIQKKIVLIMETLRKFQNHVSYNYIFRKKILNEEFPKDYTMEPFSDLNSDQERILDILISDLKEYELKGTYGFK